MGRIVTMDDPPFAEAMLIEDGVVTAVGTREEVLAAAGDEVPVMDIGQNVAYPGFIDAHSHWIGDRDYYGLDTAAEAMQAALSRGWTSIAELWVNEERIAELEELAESGSLPLRVDAYLALNEPRIGGDHFGDWYANREPGPITDWLRVRGLKIHLDHGAKPELLWEADELNRTIAAANQAGWQVAVHAMRADAHEMLLDAYEAALGPTGPNPLHHRIEHAIEVTDAQLERMAAMQIPVVIHLDTAVADWLGGPDALADLNGETAWLTRWRDFVDAGLHVAGATDAPWIFPDFVMTDDIGRPVDQIAGGMDPRGRVYPNPPPWMAQQLLTAQQGLRAVTLDAAWGLGDEARRGHLATGTLGDVTILSGDVTAATPDEIRAMRVLATIVNGVPAFCPDVDFCPPTTD
ncbi:MAG TPA: amidohydrolase family protein [Candidatus Limnocylindria bacterium]|nr:amidohydrolase family protein [Candidatus Limnocylindria bacterium]